MDFIDTWRNQLPDLITECAHLAADPTAENLSHALLAVGVLWPLRDPVRTFDLPVIGLVNNLLGGKARHLLREVQSWQTDNKLELAQRLAGQVATNPDLAAAVNQLIQHFEASATFEAQLSQSSPAAVSTVDEGQPSRVFISYARSDGEDLARRLRQQLEAEGILVWQDRVKMVGGRDWWLQITEALNEVDFMVLVATPGALRSEVVGKEWRYARQQGVCVVPVAAGYNLSVDLLPRWMRNIRFYHPVDDWQTLVTMLNSPCGATRVPFMAEELTDDFVPRLDPLSRLRAALLDDAGNPLAATTVLFGTGGYGKTTLARAICHEDDIRFAFDDGLLWVTLGDHPGDLTERVVDLIEVLTGARQGFANLDAAAAHLADLLAERDILLVLDDVWDAAHLKPFLRDAPRCARLVTTRNASLAPPQARTIDVEAMSQAEAVALLCKGLPAAAHKSFSILAERLAHWPLLLKLTNATLRDRVTNNRQPLEDAIQYVNRALDKRGLTAFDVHNAAERSQAVSQTLAVSQELLNDAGRERYAELAIFPYGVNIPLDMVHKLWQSTGGLDETATLRLCERLHQLSLLAHFDANSEQIILQRIVRNYLAKLNDNRLATFHRQFLDACALNLPRTPAGLPRWSSLAANAAYLWAHLAEHLLAAGRGPELVSTVEDISYLVRKTHLRGPTAVEADLLLAQQVDAQDPALTRLHQAFSQSSHMFSECGPFAETASTIHSRLRHYPGLGVMLDASAALLPRPLITATHRLPDLPDSSLVRTLTGHEAVVVDCDICADGSRVVSIDRHTVVKIWDAATGGELFSLGEPSETAGACAISADGRLALAGAWDGSLKIWETRTGRLRFSIHAHDAPIYALAVSADGSTLVTGAKDRTLKVWDGLTGEEKFTLTGHERAVTGCDITPDGRLIISCAPDATLKIWEAATGDLRQSLAAYQLEDYNPLFNLTFTAAASAELNCAISADGRTAVSSLPDGLMKVWDIDAGQERAMLRGHTGWIESCAISADGSQVISASNDKTIRGWDAATGQSLFVLEGHARPVTGCAVSADGATLVSSSQDKTLKIWHTEYIEPQPEEMPLKAGARCGAVDANGRWLAFDSTGNALTLLDATTAAPHTVLKGHSRPITGCALGRQVVVTASQDRTLKTWDAATGRLIHTLQGHTWAVSGCAISRDEAVIVSASDDSTLKIWDAATGQEQLTLAGHMRGVNCCVFSPDEQFIVSAGADKTVRVWNRHSAAPRHVLTGHSAPVNHCAVSPDGQWIASAGIDDVLNIWSLSSGERLGTLTGHTNSVAGCAFHPGGQYLLSVSRDQTVRVWSVPNFECVTSLRVDGALSACAWQPDGEQILAVGPRGIYLLRVMW